MDAIVEAARLNKFANLFLAWTNTAYDQDRVWHMLEDQLERLYGERNALARLEAIYIEDDGTS